MLEIMAGLKNREFFFHFQPILDLQTGTQIGAEMLIRWIRDGEVLLPSRFFPSIEENSLLKSLDQYVIQQVQDLNWDQMIHPDNTARLFINVSTESISDPAFLAPMRAVAKQVLGLGMIPVVELSERTRFDPYVITAGIEDLRRNGVEVALDDFGVGYSSLARLVHLPLDILKIDRHLTSTIGQAGRGEAILESVLTLAKNIGVKVVVEGVETQGQAEWIKARSDCWVQGYLFGYPAPMDFSVPSDLPADGDGMESGQ
ncbi:MAG TPA: EAL domain-containing protein [Anaerolineaceae bacterium]|jgi:EAL domain-containing protein (putative c-di-GMP-specific phosphodiesterase class I)